MTNERKKIDYERAKRINVTNKICLFLSIHKFSIIWKNSLEFRIRKVQHNFITSERKKILQASEASEVIINKQTFKYGNEIL